jgi:hypothetical protein
MIDVAVRHGRAHVNAVTVMYSKLHSKLQARNYGNHCNRRVPICQTFFTILISFDQQVLILCRALASAIEPCSARPLFLRVKTIEGWQYYDGQEIE